MATLKATIKKEKMRSDKTWNVLIRLTHERMIRYISTTMYVTKKDLTASFKIKNQQIIDRCEDLIKIYRSKINSLNLELNSMDIDTIVDYLKAKDDKSGIDFIAFERKWCIAPPEIIGIKRKERVFNFHERFSSMADLNRAINIGLKEVEKDIKLNIAKSIKETAGKEPEKEALEKEMQKLGIHNLQFYSARHSMATIAINKAGISKYIVNDMLCHVDTSMKITELYIQKDFNPINEANFKLLD